MSDKRTVLVLAFLMGLVASMAFLFFFNQSMRLDESQSLWQTGRSAAEILTIVAQDVHVPLYHEMLHFWRLLAGGSVESARVLSLIFYIASIPAMYLLGRLAYGERAGLFAATLMSVSPFMNWYGSEVRMYTLFVLLTILNQYCFMQMYRERGADRRTWALYAFTALLGIFTHYFFFLVLASQAVFFFLKRDIFPRGTFLRLAGIAGMLALLFSPWAWWVYHQGQASQASPVLAAPTSIDFFSTFSQFMFGFQSDHLNGVILSLWPIIVLLGFFALRKKRAPFTPDTLYFLITLLLSMSAAFIASVLIEPVFVSRYLIFTLPSFYLLVTALIAQYPPRAASLARYAVVGFMLVGLVTEMVNGESPVKEDYRAAAQYLTQNAQPQDIVILSAPFTVYPVEYYYRGTAPIATIPAWDRYSFGPIPAFASERLPQEVDNTIRDHQYAWLLLSYDQGYEEEVRVFFDENLERVAMLEFSPGLTLWVYKIRYDTPLADEQFAPTAATSSAPFLSPTTSPQ